MKNTSKNSNKNLLIFLASFVGAIYLIYYILRASTDVVASDYIRLIYYYLHDVNDLTYLKSWDFIVSIPFNFLARKINVDFFSYSVYFDKILGVIGLFIFNTILLKYVFENYKKKSLIKFLTIGITFVSFSLMSWEMLLNGTGYSHFITSGLVVVIIYLYDKIVKNFILKNHFHIKEILMYILLLIITSLVFAGQYVVSYSFALFVFSFGYFLYIFKFGKSIKKINSKNVFIWIMLIILPIILILCYYKSYSQSEFMEIVGKTDISLMELLKLDYIFPIKFLLKSLASSIIGVETLNYALLFYTINNNFILILGSIYLLIILLTLYFIIKYKLINKNLFAIMFIFIGAANYGMIFLARFGFLRDDYGMSSRYSLQYMFLTIGIILILSSMIDNDIFKNVTSKKYIYYLKNCVMFFFILFILYGHLITNIDEIYKSDYRKEAYIKLKDIALHYEKYDDETLKNSFEYQRSAEHIKDGLKLLKEKKLNIFREDID